MRSCLPRAALAATTPPRPAPDVERSARAAAERHSIPYLPRGGLSLPALAASAGADALLVLGRDAVLWIDGAPRRWHAGMGALRARRLDAGEGVTADPFLEAAGLRPGDAVLDCTLGLGADARVAAGVVGRAGRVTGLESSSVLAAWAAEGFRRLPDGPAARVEVVAADHAAWLETCPERSFDVVVFDPMFRHARAGGPAFDLVRRLADPRPLSAAALARARRVARRRVVVKDGTPGWDLARLGLAPLPSRRGAHRLYATLDAALDAG